MATHHMKLIFQSEDLFWNCYPHGNIMCLFFLYSCLDSKSIFILICNSQYHSNIWVFTLLYKTITLWNNLLRKLEGTEVNESLSVMFCADEKSKRPKLTVSKIFCVVKLETSSVLWYLLTDGKKGNIYFLSRCWEYMEMTAIKIKKE